LCWGFFKRTFTLDFRGNRQDERGKEMRGKEEERKRRPRSREGTQRRKRERHSLRKPFGERERENPLIKRVSST